MRKVHITCSLLIELVFVLLAVCWLCGISEQSGSAVFHIWVAMPLGLLLVSHLAWLLSWWYITLPIIVICDVVLLGEWLLDTSLLTIVGAQLLLYALVCMNHRKTIKYLRNK